MSVGLLRSSRHHPNAGSGDTDKRFLLTSAVLPNTEPSRDTRTRT